jgi:putative nucleotidyltransferase with HDIG domain
MTDDSAEIPSLAISFQIALNVLRVHEPANEAARRALKRLLETIHAAFLEDGECSLVKSGDQLFVNATRMRNVHDVADLMGLLDRLEIGGFEFSSPPEPEALTEFMVALARRGKWEAPDECFVEPVSNDLPSSGEDEKTPRTERVYRKAIGEMRAVFQEANGRGSVSIRRARRVSGNLMETLTTDDTVLFGLMAIREYDQYTFQHCVNVCILSTVLGTRLGFSRSATRELGVAGLLHDVGKLAIPRRVLNKPGRLTPAEWDVMKTHPAAGARMLLRERGLEPGIVKAVKVALHHHIRFDGGGYPRLTFSTAPSLFSRIITIADVYDAMTSVRVYRALPILPPNAMAYIWSERGRFFHPALVKAFVSMVGAYPPGSVVRLSDGSVAVVVEPPRGADPFSPVVKAWGSNDPMDLDAAESLRIVGAVNPDDVDASDAEIAGHLRAA